MWYTGITSAFQADEGGSTPPTRSRLSLKLQTIASKMYYVYILKSSKSGSGKAFVYKRLVNVAVAKNDLCGG